MRSATMILVVSAVAVTGCETQTVELVVDLRTDFAAGVEFVGVRTRLDSGGVEEQAAFRGEDYTESHRIAEFTALTSGTRTVTVTLVDLEGRDVIERRVRITQASTFSVTVLISRDCAEASCPGPGDAPDAVECLGGRCAPVDCVTGTEASCPEAECAAASDCSPMAACARAECRSGSCLYAEQLASCAGGEYCAVERGCEPLPDPTDAGMDDASVSDAGTDAGAADSGTCDEMPCGLLLPQCGCPGGQMCQRTMAGTTFRECVAAGSSVLGGACANSLDCMAGHGCVGIGGAGGACARYCSVSADCATDSECMLLGVTAEPIGSCNVVCDPLALTGCPEGLACLFLQGARREDMAAQWVTMCGVDTFATEGSPCDMGVLCAPGNICHAGTCRQACDMAASVCATGTCSSVSGGPVLIAGVDYGACI